MSPAPLGIMASGVSSSFDPTSIAGLTAWWDAADSATFTYSSGVVVSQWADKSGNAYHLGSGSLASSPTRVTGSMSQPIVRFDGSDDKVATTPSITLAQPYTLFAAAHMTTSRSVAAMITRGPSMMLFSWTTTWAYHAGGGVPGTTTYDTNPHAFSVVYDGTSSAMWIDGTSGGSGDPGSGAFSSTVLAVAAGGGGNFWPGDMGEMLLYSGALGTTDRQAVEAYLKAKWGTP